VSTAASAPLELARGKRALPWIYGHRGTRRGAPENTIEAMRLALGQGADGIELDVRLCASGEVIVLHDPDLKRVAGDRVVVAQVSLSEIQRHDLGGGAHVPLLTSALELVLGSGKLLNIELKADVPNAIRLVEKVAVLLQACTPAERARVVLSSFSAELCEMMIAALPEITVGALHEHEPIKLPAGTRAVHPRHVLVNPGLIAHAREKDLLINTWTVNDGPRAVELSKLGVDSIITDDVPAIRAALGAH
jgi:glycerophosphoryl diester phosphodiesterase